MTDPPQVLLAHHLKTLKLPTFLREYDKLARQCATEGADHVRYLVRLTELELIDRERRMVERRIRQARFPAVKSLDSFDFKAIASLNKMLVLELARCEYVERRENIIALGNSGTGKTHIALGLAACQKGLSVGFLTAAALVHELMEARDEKRLLRLQKQLAKYHLLIIDELGFVPLSKTGAELLFEVFSQRYERGSILVTSNLPFDEWTEIFGSERLTGAMVDPVGPQEPPALLRSAYRKRYTKQRGSLLWTTGTPPQHRVPHNIKWTSFAPPGWTNFAPPLTLTEFGVIAAQGVGSIALLRFEWGAAKATLPEQVVPMTELLFEQIAALSQKIAGLEKEIRSRTRAREEMKRLMTIPGIGPICAMAVSAFAPPMESFGCGRDFAAWIGLTPRQHSTAGKQRLGRITKMGQRDLRQLLVLGATSVLRHMRKREELDDPWLRRMIAEKPPKLVAVALANKMARIIWALSVKKECYRAPVATAAAGE